MPPRPPLFIPAKPSAVRRSPSAVHASFFAGEAALSNGVYYLALPNGNPFGYYAYLPDSNYIYHFDAGYEYVFDANDGKGGVYFYDFTSGDWWYTGRQYPFPYIYDFGLSAFLYYFPDTNNAGHYTTNPRYFYNFTAGAIIALPAPPTSRTLHAGDTYQYSGSGTTKYVSTQTSPNPSSTVTAQIAQSVSVLGGASFNGQSNIFDVRSSETDSTALQQSSLTLDGYYQIVASKFISWGYSSSDSFGETITEQYGNPGPGFVQLDKIPETAGDSWSNGPAARITEISPGGQSAQRTYNADGSYTDVTTYPSGSLSTPSPDPVTATITENGDGSGSYSLPFQGPLNAGLSFSKPDASGTITIAATFPDSSSQTFTTPVWWPQPLALYQESIKNNGTVQIPSACAAAAAFGSTANSLTDTSARVDTILGTIETIVQTSYIIPKYGTVCVQLSDSLKMYYDYSGQAGTISFGDTTPLSTETFSSTVGLVSASVGTSSHMRALKSAESAIAIANGRSRFIARSERRRLAFQRRLLSALHRHVFGMKR